MFILWLLESERAVVVMAGGDGGQQRTVGLFVAHDPGNLGSPERTSQGISA